MQCEHHQGCTEESTEPPGDPASATARAPNLKKTIYCLGLLQKLKAGEKIPHPRTHAGRRRAVNLLMLPH